MLVYSEWWLMKRLCICSGNHKKIRRYKGIRLLTSGRWGATIFDTQKHKTVCLGTYDTEEAAAMAYDAAALELGRSRGHLNFPERAKNPPSEGNKTTRTKYRGVHLTPSGNWCARSWDPNKRASAYMGMFRTAEEAAKAYDEAALKLYGYRAVLNFPDSEADPCPQFVDLCSGEKSSPRSMPTLLSHEDGQNHESSLPSSSSTPPASPKRLKTYAGKSPSSAPRKPADTASSSSGSPSRVNSQQLPVIPSNLGFAQFAGNAASSDIRPWKTVVDASLTSEDVIGDSSPVLPRFPDPSPTYDHTLVSTFALPGLHLKPKSSEESLFAKKAEISELHQKCKSCEKAALLAKSERDDALLQSSVLLKDKERISAELEACQLRVAQLEEDSSWIFSVLKDAIVISNEARKQKDAVKKNEILGLISKYFDDNSLALRDRFGYLDQLHPTTTISVDDLDPRVPGDSGCSSTKDKVSTCLKLCL